MVRKVEKAPQTKTRDARWDGVRVIGLLAIILAHVNPPSFLFQLRNFDVPLMVLVSGAVYGISSSSTKKYFTYIWGRVMRLLAPTWIFLSIFFLGFFIAGHPFSTDTIVSSFALLNGIGYVWIIRVFILVAIIAPLFVHIYRRSQNKNVYLVGVLLIYVLYNFIHAGYTLTTSLHSVAVIDFVFQNIIFYILPFGCVAGLGIYLSQASRKSAWLLTLGFILVSLSLAYIHHFAQTQPYKYPPGMYYLSYALAVSLLLYLWSNTKLFQKLFSQPLLLFMAASSLWIYLWQIFFLFLWSFMDKSLPSFMHNYLVEYVLIVFLSTIFTYLQKYVVKNMVGYIRNEKVKAVIEVSLLK